MGSTKLWSRLENNPQREGTMIKDIRKKIIHSFMYNPIMKFNQLWNKEGRSNKFAYHLKKLVSEGFLQKINEGYTLTHKGRQEIAYRENNSGGMCQFPLTTVITVIVDEKTNKFLMLQRSKQPFLGFWGLHGQKLKFNQYILESARASIKEETGLECEVALKGLFSTKTYNRENILYSHQHLMVKATNPRGSMLARSNKGVNKWMTREEMKSVKMLPNIQLMIDVALSENFRWVEADRTKEEDGSVKMDVLRDVNI